MTDSQLDNTNGGVPDLVRTPALDIGADDIALPALKIGQGNHGWVEEGLVARGDIFTVTGKEDPDPQKLWEFGSDEPGPLFQVLSLRRGKSISDDDDELLLFDYDDPDAPADAWVTYNYLVALPEVDDTVPYKLLLTKSGRPSALQINLVLKKTESSGPSWNVGFRLTTSKRENTKKGHKWWVPRVSLAEPSKEAIEAAEALFPMAAAAPVKKQITSGNEPAI